MSSQESKEVLRVVRNTANVLKNISNMIPDAMKENPSLRSELHAFNEEIGTSKAVMDLIKNQEGLHTLGVVARIKLLQSQGDIVMNDSEYFDDKGPKDMARTIENFRAKRKALADLIRLASVGLIKSDSGYKIQANVVKSTNHAVKKVLGKEGLAIANFLAGLKREPDTNGEIRLSAQEHATFEKFQLGSANTEVSKEGKTRIICNCLARDQSIQILGPIGIDMWSEMTFVKSDGLVAMGNATQFAYPISLEVFREVVSIKRAT